MFEESLDVIENIHLQWLEWKLTNQFSFSDLELFSIFLKTFSIL